MVLYQTGLRRAELSALNWAAVDLAEGLLIVRHGKGDKFRIAPLQPHSHQAPLKLQRAARKLAMAGPADQVFTSVNVGTGRRLTPAGLSHVIASIGRRAGLPGLHPDQFRHTNVHQRLVDLHRLRPGDMRGLTRTAAPARSRITRTSQLRLRTCPMSGEHSQLVALAHAVTDPDA